MAINRVRVAKDKADLVRDLTESENKSGPFQTYADVIVFAASVGIRHQKRVPIEAVSQRDPAPISLEIFISRGYDWVIKLIAIAHTKDSKTISPFDPELEAERVKIFEEFANGGLEILREEFRGAVDYGDRLLLLLMSERDRFKKPESEFDLSQFLG
ncbi:MULTISPECIES: DNA phosphorothioation-associated protein 4 [Oscillatoriales]|jgi:dnd system-associated protein 4|uniref:DNA phosphorothioation-associated protein 4 n=4 Tax=Limnospira TaxID=2596745 RepID=A0A9P1KFQ7_9CYAN|nr:MULTISPECIES: DNA phosphorothioation-associated protein 4 [Oscillatoriales]AMW30795.1 dnd system-associated protein 4 [Arthrospira platensis YZ]EKD07230.1 hypothetical protein SPLC1_S490630 [Arthrospira platensis C1]KDR55183.1 hypothetical protein APPUASWS_024130 [Arthrospira platensis str. Paraca]MBD2671855.1 DNA phosphorothioation-associated protein 4 [Arthrospira platensis FACHB-439]MBD2712829.1 DNA phosphorothioation-associated protein 4 [Arthrospira platensis FACHB-835]MDF2208124.1 DN